MIKNNINHTLSQIRKLPLLSNRRGVMLPSLLIFTVAFTIIGLALASFSISEYSRTHRAVYQVNSLMVAEAGIEQGLHGLNEDDNFPGFTQPQEFFDNESQGYGTFTATIEDESDSEAKIITSTGHVYRNQGDGEPIGKSTIRATVVGTASEGYSVQSGPGGLILSGSGSITNADVYVDGY